MTRKRWKKPPFTEGDLVSVTLPPELIAERYGYLIRLAQIESVRAERPGESYHRKEKRLQNKQRVERLQEEAVALKKINSGTNYEIAQTGPTTVTIHVWGTEVLIPIKSGRKTFVRGTGIK